MAVVPAANRVLQRVGGEPCADLDRTALESTVSIEVQKVYRGHDPSKGGSGFSVHPDGSILTSFAVLRFDENFRPGSRWTLRINLFDLDDPPHAFLIERRD